METSLHRSLKERYASGGDGRPEVPVRGFRIDAMDDAGRLVEVQSGPLGPLRGKLSRLLPDHRIRIVKPVDPAARGWSVGCGRDGPDLSARSSPKRGAIARRLRRPAWAWSGSSPMRISTSRSWA